MGLEGLLAASAAVAAVAGAQPAAAPSRQPPPAAPAPQRPDDAATPRDPSAPAGTPVRVEQPSTAIATSGTTAAPATGVIGYPAAFFADNRPQTALDMINRLPGFSFEAGDSVRGFSGAAGNVLIDGRRPSSKTDSLDSVLGRIVAREVERIEVIRGGAPGIDMQGRAVVANVIRRTGDQTRITVQGNESVWQDGHSVPGGKIEFNKRVGAHTYEGQLGRYQSFDDSVGDGRIVTTLRPRSANPTVISLPARSSGDGGGVGLTGSYKGPQLGGELRLNTRLEQLYFKSGLSYGEYPPSTITNDRSRTRRGEFGMNYDRKLGPYELETVVLQRLGRVFNGSEQTLTALASGGPGRTTFSQVNNTGESVGRAVLRRSFTPKLTLEAGAEGAFNFLDGSTRFTQDGINIPLPSADVRVEEIRGEGYLQARYKHSDKLTLEGAVRFEGSNISETGDAVLSRTFYYLKPRANLTWSPTANDQVRLRVEKRVGQLNFSDFVSSADLQSSTANTGNPELQPDQRWQYEAAWEHRFWGRGAVVLRYTHEEIENVVDLLPVVGPGFFFDSPGNIGDGTNDELSIQGTVPLDKLRIPGGLLKTTSTWRVSDVRDPLTGQSRRISGQRPDIIQVDFTQDLARIRGTWGFSWFYGWRETYFRVAEEQRRRIPPPGFFTLFYDYKPNPDLAFRVSLQNFVPFAFERRRTLYDGPRNLGGVRAQEDLVIQSQPRIDVRLRKTFG